jgi:hypothetical protein
MIEKFINDFTSEVRDPNVFLFSLILANKFNGEVLIYMDEDDEGYYPDIIVLINGKIYDMFGEIDEVIVELDSYAIFDKLSLLKSVKMYNYCKWAFMYEVNEDQMYYNEVN